MANMNSKKHYASFKEFYPFYLQEHKNKVCRRLHFVGSLLVLTTLFIALYLQQFTLLWLCPVIGYGFAWMGHFFFEKNRPATFTHPVYSFIGDWVMFKDIIVRKVPW